MYKSARTLVLSALLLESALSFAGLPKGVPMSSNGRLTLTRSSNPLAISRPVIVGIPGGPGLSSRTLKGIEALGTEYDLALIDPPGTGGTSELMDPSLANIVESIESLLIPMNRPVVLLGHSFGGLYVAQIAIRGKLPNLNGIIFLASPLSRKAISDLEQQYKSQKTAELEKTEIALEEDMSNDSLTKWFSAYERLFFTSAFLIAGAKLISVDNMSYRSFFSVRLAHGASSAFESLFKKVDTPKLFLVGSEDVLVRPEAIEAQSQELSGDFAVIQSAGHFCFLEASDITSAIIFDWIKTRTK